MTKAMLNIQLALKKAKKPKLLPRPPSPAYNIEAKLYKNRDKYEIIDLHFELGKSIGHWHDPKCFINTLNVNKDKKELLWLVADHLFYYLCSEEYSKLPAQIISESYLYFCFSDYNDEMIFATPHMTSPVLFNPNEPGLLYELGNCGTLRDNRAKTVERELLKKVDMNVLQMEVKEPLKKTLEEQVVAYTMVGIVNSLFNYYENKAPKNSHIVELGSIYEDKKETGAILPSISSISTYEFRAFNYVGGPVEDIEF
jgi:hypothetical protein